MKALLIASALLVAVVVCPATAGPISPDAGCCACVVKDGAQTERQPQQAIFCATVTNEAEFLKAVDQCGAVPSAHFGCEVRAASASGTCSAVLEEAGVACPEARAPLLRRTALGAAGAALLTLVGALILRLRAARPSRH